MREAVRSGRRANFFITENRFIDCYAAKVGGSGVAVYSILQRCANSETKETWISAHKMAEVLDIDRSTVYRQLKQLEDLRLIKSMRTREKTIYVVLPVPPPRPEAGSTPLFDAIDPKSSERDANWPVAPAGISPTSETDSRERNASVAQIPQPVSSARPDSRTGENRNKEEQDVFNKTQEQDLRGNKTLQVPPYETDEARTQKGILRIVELMGMPGTPTNLRIIEAAVKAEIQYAGRSPDDAVSVIAGAAISDREKGVQINKFWFEDAKWRSRGRTGKGQQQFERIKRARDEAHAIIDAEMDR
ncbi:MAG TPA: helix-turn-helix domain-containing protein [Terriglobales bacterium]|nr:helix-turn-helix domain-containing protein [Terriglobales bacterium]